VRPANRGEKNCRRPENIGNTLLLLLMKWTSEEKSIGRPIIILAAKFISMKTAAYRFRLDYKDAHNQNIHITGYPTEKNLEMLKLIIEASSNEDDLVLDCFAGSGTTLVAADMLKRNWIGIDNSPHAIKTIVERFQVGTKPMGDYVTAKTAQKQADQVELSLFNNATEKNGRLTKFGSNHAESINDYTLLVTKELQDELSRNLPV
jgi:adenine specific DNA methylase Mod